MLPWKCWVCSNRALFARPVIHYLHAPPAINAIKCWGAPIQNAWLTAAPVACVIRSIYALIQQCLNAQYYTSNHSCHAYYHDYIVSYFISVIWLYKKNIGLKFGHLSLLVMNNIKTIIHYRFQHRMKRIMRYIVWYHFLTFEGI